MDKDVHSTHPETSPSKTKNCFTCPYCSKRDHDARDAGTHYEVYCLESGWWHMTVESSAAILDRAGWL